MDGSFEADRREIAERGSLAAALNAELDQEQPVRFTGPPAPRAEFSALIGDDRSTANVDLAVDRYVVRFNRQGLEWAAGSTADRRSVVAATTAWLSGAGLEQLAREWPFVEFSELQLAYERGDALETQWRIVRRDASPLLREVVELAWAAPTVRRFFPLSGHNLLFTAGEHSSAVLASVMFVGPGTYRLYAGRREPEVEAAAAQVIARLAELLETKEPEPCPSQDA
ncbi:hypothetical protein [Kitasatospora sp. NPDC097643]|uniref:hypothetical protein n=1 Tax=Kitasatospora sp. NPDC097643 TaxID=3157230 RepID=UPI00331D8D98